MQLNPTEISNLIRQKIENFDSTIEAHTEGTVVSLTDGIVRIHGLQNVMYGEMIKFEGNLYRWLFEKQAGKTFTNTYPLKDLSRGKSECS